MLLPLLLPPLPNHPLPPTPTIVVVYDTSASTWLVDVLLICCILERHAQLERSAFQKLPWMRGPNTFSSSSNTSLMLWKHFCPILRNQSYQLPNSSGIVHIKAWQILISLSTYTPTVTSACSAGPPSKLTSTSTTRALVIWPSKRLIIQQQMTLPWQNWFLQSSIVQNKPCINQ